VSTQCARPAALTIQNDTANNKGGAGDGKGNLTGRACAIEVGRRIGCQGQTVEGS
jgi:hypothetical protein